MKAVFSTRAFTAVKAETTEKVTTETGGLFLGIYKIMLSDYGILC